MRCRIALLKSRAYDYFYSGPCVCHRKGSISPVQSMIFWGDNRPAGADPSAAGQHRRHHPHKAQGAGNRDTQDHKKNRAIAALRFHLAFAPRLAAPAHGLGLGKTGRIAFTFQGIPPCRWRPLQGIDSRIIAHSCENPTRRRVPNLKIPRRNATSGLVNLPIQALRGRIDGLAALCLDYGRQSDLAARFAARNPRPDAIGQSSQGPDIVEDITR